MTSDDILQEMKSLHSPADLVGMARFGINTQNAYGISVNTLRKMAKAIGRDHSLALELWASGIHEARILASIIEVPELVADKQMDAWASDFDSWDVCDACCYNLFDRTNYAYQKPAQWAERDEEFVKRAAFALIAGLAVHDKKAEDAKLAQFLPIIISASTDDRNFVKKAVNWAVRQIGKRNRRLNELAIETAREIQQMNSRSARWIAADALRELNSEAVQKRLKS
jgi:3-methyladenine DNA glycosylase AlkD